MAKRLESLERFPYVVQAAREQVGHGYIHGNRYRVPLETYVIQQTHSGSAILEGREGTHTIGPGQAMIFAYGEETTYRINDHAEDAYDLSFVALRPQGGIAGLITQIRQDFGDCIQMSDTGEAARSLMTLVNYFQNAEKPDLLVLAEVAYQLLIQIYREQVSGSQGTDPVAYLRYLLQSQFRNPRNITEWMQDIPVSREHMTREFRQRYGETPGTYLRRLRLEFARSYAASSSLGAEDIASDSGFVSAQTLRRAFRDHFGYSLGSFQLQDKQPRAVPATGSTQHRRTARA